MTHNLNRITSLMLIGFVLVALSLTYWSAFGSDSMLARDDNPRLVETERALFRGGIYDRKGEVLALTERIGTSPSGKAVVQRRYPFVEASSAIGYYSLVHGVGGAEAAFDTQLRGNDIRDVSVRVGESLLHLPQIGSDLKLTIDAQLQRSIAAKLKGKQGAVVLLDIPSGAVLALVSLPTFDPNQLETTFKALQKDPTSPLLNRATQGLYQPGGALQTVILAALLTHNVDVTGYMQLATEPVQINGHALTCIGSNNGGTSALTLVDAYGLACPTLFAESVVEDAEAMQQMIEAFGLLQAPNLPHFGTESGAPIQLLQLTDPDALRKQGAGQGALTVTPLQMALVAATIANDGKAITPYLADSLRLPSVAEWQPLNDPLPQHAVITQEVTDDLDEAMRHAVESGAAQAAQQPGLEIHGHASIAFTGPQDRQAAWFIGYVVLPDGRAVAIATVIENADAALAAQVSGEALREAAAIVR